ncbi:PBSX family phage terminase large subunit [Mucilaginibacter sp.]|uniref:PBSX family phage terminase large subunit n=1 Tax=Mucilaginibacter sp. TaxID=1882438 RepID=UPI000CBD8EAD|nr:terminase large subunit [Mucilaginibacter sp.]PLW90235.1 MAG: terminase [Mucilaginibacter sp.]HEK21225.1 terminase [Bacteroidota bacterium]
MHEKTSILFKYNYECDAQIIINQGGTSSGKTYAILQVLFCLAVEMPKQIITVVGQDIPNLKAGALRDALSIQAASDTLKLLIKNYNKTDRIIEFNNGSIIEFKSYANGQDAKSGKRDFLFINEANGISWEVYSELALRTRKRIFIDYNPNTGFWVHERLIGKPGVQLFISDHRHNPFTDDATRSKIERLKIEDIELWKVYARGLTGKVSGLVFTNWHLCEHLPPDAKLIAAGLDFGFSNDETGCLLVYKQNGELWINELIYETGLTNTDLSDKLKSVGISTSTEIIADSAEPKSIEELRRLGWYISPAKKGPDSIKNAIDILKRYTINVTRSSVNLRKELSKYTWKTDKSGQPLNQPIDAYNHLIDPLRYVALNKLMIKNHQVPRSRLPLQHQSAQNTFADQMHGML